MVTWSGCSIKDSVVVVDNGDHVIAATLKLRLCIYVYAHAKCARHVRTGGTKGVARRRLTSISIETAHTRSRDREHARRDGGKDSRGRAHRVER